jgi:hypothetical protein
VYHRFSIPDGGGTVRETTIDRLYFDAETGLMQMVPPTSPVSFPAVSSGKIRCHNGDTNNLSQWLTTFSAVGYGASYMNILFSVIRSAGFARYSSDAKFIP